MTKYYLLLLLFVGNNAISQTVSNKRQIELIVGRSVHGTGDTRGLNFSVEYSKYFKKRLNWSASIGGTIHDGVYPIFFEYPAGVQNDGSIRYTTAGLQVLAHLGYNFIKSSRHELLFRLGSALRYQSSSYWDVFSVLYPPITGLAYPVVVFENSTPQRTFAVGGTTQIKYSYTTSRHISLGIFGGFQFDSNGDTISHLSFTIGKRF
jgi:hypothetical protein